MEFALVAPTNLSPQNKISHHARWPSQLILNLSRRTRPHHTEEPFHIRNSMIAMLKLLFVVVVVHCHLIHGSKLDTPSVKYYVLWHLMREYIFYSFLFPLQF